MNDCNYCPNCGTKVNKEQDICLNCGCFLKKEEPPRQKSNIDPIAWAVLGFFVPVAGLILFLIWKDSQPEDAKAAGKGALISVIVSAAIGLISILIMFAVIPLAASQAATEMTLIAPLLNL